MRNGKQTIVLALDLNGATCRDYLSGILKFAPKRPNWTLKFAFTEQDLLKELSTDEKPNGVINAHPTRSILQALNRHRTLPVVTCPYLQAPSRMATPNRTYITDDNASIARIAYGHFKSLGKFRSYAYVPPLPDTGWSNEREREFVRLAKADGETPFVYRPSKTALTDLDALKAFLVGLPKPAAVFCAYDVRAQEVVLAAQRERIAIPGEMSVIGVDNDEAICESTRPRITSVRADHVGTGLLMAQELDKLMRSRTPPAAKSIRIPALDVIVRETSTPTAPGATYLIQRALDFIGKNASGRLRVEDVARHLGVSRRLLEYRFAQYESRSIATSIRDAWLARAKELLSRPTAKATNVAHQLGFANPKSFHAIFTRETGVTPGAWKNASRLSPVTR